MLDQVRGLTIRRF